MEYLQEAKKLLAEVHAEKRFEILELELQAVVQSFDRQVREYAAATEEAAFDNLTRTTSRTINDNPEAADAYVDELWRQIYRILWRQDWHVRQLFETECEHPWRFRDKAAFSALVEEGRAALDQGNMSRLRGVVYELYQLRYSASEGREMEAEANIIATS